MRKAIVEKLLLEKLGSDKLTVVNSATLNALGFIGYSDESLVEKVIPQLALLEQSGEKITSKEIVKRIKELVPPPPKPQALVVNNETTLRRYDSLARLLCPNEKVSACVAVSSYEGQWIISSNASAQKSESELISLLDKRLGIIRGFINTLVNDVNPDDSQEKSLRGDDTSIVFSTKTRLLAKDVIETLMKEENGGFTSPMPIPAKRAKGRGTNIEHLTNALLKVAQHCLLGLHTKGDKGFSLSEIDGLLNDEATIILPHIEKLDNQRLHAEQAILAYLNAKVDVFKAEEGSIINVGISKLCCQTCQYVLSQGQFIAFRGGHGMAFPNVYNLREDSFHTQETSYDDPFAPDSDSDCEFEFEVDDELDIIPDATKLLDAFLMESKPQAPSIKYTLSHRFLGVCTPKEKGETTLIHRPSELKV